MKNSFKLNSIAVVLLALAPVSGAFAVNGAIGFWSNDDSSNNGEDFLLYSGNVGGNPLSAIILGDDGVISVTATTNNINGTTNITGATTVTGIANINTTGTAASNIGTGGGNTNIGSSGSTNTVVGTNVLTGTTSINASNNAATNINTGSSTAAVTVGNALNTTNLNSLTNNIGVNSTAANVTVTTANTYTNNMGTGTGKTVNNIGNANTTSLVNAQAGSAKMTLANDSAQLTVPSAASGVNNGFAATASQSAMTGGDVDPTRMTLTDRDATFSRVSNGAPITVTGVADGRADFDAVNVRQFAAAVAAVAAQANVPPLAAGQDKSFGVGLGNFMGKSAIAMGLNIRGANNASYKLSVSSGLEKGGSKAVVGAGAAWAF